MKDKFEDYTVLYIQSETTHEHTTRRSINPKMVQALHQRQPKRPQQRQQRQHPTHRRDEPRRDSRCRIQHVRRIQR